MNWNQYELEPSELEQLGLGKSLEPATARFDVIRTVVNLTQLIVYEDLFQRRVAV